MAASFVVPRGAFSKYDKMAESSGSVGASAGHSCADCYVVTEKVHGANFCMIAAFCEDGAFAADSSSAQVLFAKRTAILGCSEDAEDFYSCRSSGLLRTLAPCAEALLRRRARAEAQSGDTSTRVVAVHIYGELFGGRYPHLEVPAVQGLKPVQVGVWYSPNLKFMAFDVAIEEETREHRQEAAADPSARQRRFLNFGEARELCKHCDILFAGPLFTGTLAECLDQPVEFVTTLPARLGLPPLECQNLAEGLVVRPIQEPFLRSSPAISSGKESHRGLFKRKIPAFSERRYQNDDWRKGKAGGGFTVAVSDEELARMEVLALVTEQRLANVLSKIGRIDPSNKPACIQLLEDFKADVQEELGESEEGRALRRSTALQAELDGSCRCIISRELKGRLHRSGTC
mmetsp:Transcript_43454/g.70415  ORF Transcript_43454/g.70415 Transcript_43454/m.70415 type:complete len:402 (-) Transcript_43454:87-1292(-)